MDIIHEKVSNITREEIDLIEEEMVANYFLINSYWQLFALIGSYLFFVLKLGPRLMENRPPYDLKYVMVVYNIVQLFFNSSYLYLVFRNIKFAGYFFEQSCHPSYDVPLENRIFLVEMGWMWFMIKVFDLVDTIFFVLRKKQSHVTFLHLYHHTVLVITVWLYMRYVRGEQAGAIAVCNCTVHFFMYLYYLLAALGPKVQKYLWWKRYITRLQLVQFGILTAFFAYLMTYCDVPPMQKVYNYYAVAQGFMFIAMFLNFYIKAYRNKSITAKNNEKSA